MFLAGLIAGGCIGFVLGVAIAAVVWASHPEKRPYLAVVTDQRHSTDVVHHHHISHDRWIGPRDGQPVRLVDAGEPPVTDSQRLIEN